MEIQELLEKRKGKRSWRALANELGVTRQTLYNVYKGIYQPGTRLRESLGLELVLRRERRNGQA